MHINVEYADPGRDTDDTSLLMDLANRGREHIFPGVDVATGLQPRTQVGVMDQEQAGSGAVHYKSAGGDMARIEMVRREGCVPISDELENCSNRGNLSWRRVILFEKVAKTC